MAEIEIPETRRHALQRVHTIRVAGDVATLEGPSLEIRLPARWARKLMPWHGGPGRTILCNAGSDRFNLIGVTKVPGHLLLSYVDDEGELKAELVTGDLLELLDGLLEGLATEQGRPG
ncbi:MAG: hypothetical protein ACE5I4_02660 [Thermoplasmata archaeon]